jgi:hypothetical protein
VGKSRHDLFQKLLIYLVEGVILIAVYVENGDKFPRSVEDGDYDFAVGIGVAGNVTGELVDVRYDDSPSGAGASTAYAPVESDVQAAQSTLIRSYKQSIQPYASVKASPRVAIKSLVQKADYGNHSNQEVSLTLEDCFHLLHYSHVDIGLFLAVHTWFACSLGLEWSISPRSPGVAE